MFEYLNRSLAGSTAESAERSTSSSAARSGNGTASCQKSPSRLSRVTPAAWLSRSRSVDSPSVVPDSSGTCVAAVSSSRRRPCSASCMTAVAVNVLECEAIRNRCLSVSGSSRSTSAWPKAPDHSTRSSAYSPCAVAANPPLAQATGAQVPRRRVRGRDEPSAAGNEPFLVARRRYPVPDSPSTRSPRTTAHPGDGEYSNSGRYFHLGSTFCHQIEG